VPLSKSTAAIPLHIINWLIFCNDKLMIFERTIMRKVFGPTRTDDGYCRIKTNQEINDILKGKNIIGFVNKG